MPVDARSALTLCAALLFATSEATAQAPQVKVSICRYEGTPEVTNAEADAILARMSALTATNGCAMTFARDGDIAVIDDPETGGFLNSDTYAAINAGPMSARFNIRIVVGITDCAGVPAAGGQIAGCSDIGSMRMSVNASAFPSNNSVIWLHEYGHNRGLEYSVEPGQAHSGDPSNVMYPVVGSDTVQLTSGQCAAYLGSSPSPSLALVHKTLPIPASPQPSVDVKTFVHRKTIHGVSFEQASKYTAKDAETLIPMLSDPAEKPYWGNIVATLCFIGDPVAVDPLIQFFHSGEGKLDTETFLAKNTVLINMGFLVNKSNSAEGLKFLLDSVNDQGAWERTPTWTGPTNAKAALDRVLTSSTLSGLANTGKPEASAELLKFKAANSSPERAKVFDRAIRTHDAITKQGLKMYMKESKTMDH